MEAAVDELIDRLDPTLPGYEDFVSIIEQQRQWQQDYEFWIGKKDYLLRQIEGYHDIVYPEEWSDGAESKIHINTTYSLRFYDFNQPITIEPPVVE